MINKVTLQPGVVLHKRPYKETSFLVDFFTRDFGRISVVAQGVRRPKSPLREIFTPFALLLISFQGKSDLKKLYESEVKYRPHDVSKFTFSCLMYVNELIILFTHKDDPHEELFDAYTDLCRQMENQSKQHEVEKFLRLFELKLLQEIGYGIDLNADASNGEAIRSDCLYDFNPSVGLSIKENTKNLEKNYFKGDDIINFSKGILFEGSVRKTAKLITRKAIDFHLDGKEIKSRTFFQTNIKQ